MFELRLELTLVSYLNPCVVGAEWPHLQSRPPAPYKTVSSGFAILTLGRQKVVSDPAQ